MNPFNESIRERAQEIRLSPAERSRIRTALVRAAAPAPSPFWMHPSFRPAAIALAAIIVVIGGGVGTASAAEGALPGDLLYPVKVGVTEPIEGALAFSASAKAKWHASVAEARLAEAEALAEKGALTSTTSAELAANFTEHASAVASIANAVGETDPVSGRMISAQFSASVASKGAAILAAGKKSDNPLSEKSSGDLVVAVAGSESAPSAASASAMAPMAKVSPAPAFSSLMASSVPDADARLSDDAHTAVATATTTLASATLPVSDEADLADDAAALSNLLVKADAEFSIGSTSEASADYSRAIRDADSLSARIAARASGADADATTTDEDDAASSAPVFVNPGGPMIPLHP